MYRVSGIDDSDLRFLTGSGFVLLLFGGLAFEACQLSGEDDV